MVTKLVFGFDVVASGILFTIVMGRLGGLLAERRGDAAGDPGIAAVGMGRMGRSDPCVPSHVGSGSRKTSSRPRPGPGSSARAGPPRTPGRRAPPSTPPPRRPRRSTASASATSAGVDRLRLEHRHVPVDRRPDRPHGRRRGRSRSAGPPGRRRERVPGPSGTYRGPASGPQQGHGPRRQVAHPPPEDEQDAQGHQPGPEEQEPRQPAGRRSRCGRGSSAGRIT